MSPNAPDLYVASLCYGGVAKAAHMRVLLELRALAARRGVAMRLDLGGGEALSGRGRAAAVAAFLKTSASHLLLTGGASAFAADAVLEAMVSGGAVVRLSERDLLVARDAARQLSAAQDVSRGALGDLRAADHSGVAMLFESIVTPDDYVADLDAVCARWRALGGRVADGRGGLAEA